MADRYIATRPVRVNGRDYARGQEVPASHNMQVLVDAGKLRREAIAEKAPEPVTAPVVPVTDPSVVIDPPVATDPPKPSRRRAAASAEGNGD